MKHKKTIIISESQLREMGGDFEYFGKCDTNPYDGMTHPTPGGILSNGETAKPVDTDRIADTMSPQTYRRYGNIYGRAVSVRESEDTNKDGVDDFYNNDAMNTLTNDTDNDDLTKVPESVIQRLDLFLDAVGNTTLTPRQNAIILTKVISKLDVKGIPYRWKRELMMKINARGGKG